jgi:hypothetical protein
VGVADADAVAVGVGVGSSAGAGAPRTAVKTAALASAVARIRRVTSLRVSAAQGARLSRGGGVVTRSGES